MSRLSTVTVLVAALAFGCTALTPPDKVAEIQKAPEKYEGQTVTIEGVVVDTASAFGYGIYKVNDRTGSMWVRTDNVPRVQTQVKVKGIVQAGLSVLGLDIGWHLKELERVQ